MRIRNEIRDVGPNPEKLRCSRCEEIKPIAEFHPPDRGRLLPRQPCRPCTVIKRREAYLQSGKRISGVDRVYAQVLAREYGMTLDDYEAMERKQGKRCAICRRPESKKRRNGERYRLAVDHDHATNEVRALLCHRCNLVVWALEDNHTTLAAVTAYIEEHRASFGGG